MRAGVTLFALLLISCGSKESKQRASATHSSSTYATPEQSLTPPAPSSASQGYTDVIAHNVILKENSSIDIRVRWLRGRMYRTHPNVVPSFDTPDSFYIDVADGAMGASLAGISSLLNSGALKGSALEKVSLSAQGKQIKLNGILHKGIPLPIEMIGDIKVSPDGNHVQIHVAKLAVLKIPVKGLLKAFRIKASELFDPKGANGIEVHGDDIYVDAAQILPPPRNRGKLTDVHIAGDGDLVEIYGSAKPEVMRTKEWRNFIRLRGGTIELGKLTMRNADVLIVDASQDEWFEFDLAHYEEQLVNGYTLMTAQAGLRIFMPDITKIARNDANRKISAEWMKNRNLPPPPDPAP